MNTRYALFPLMAKLVTAFLVTLSPLAVQGAITVTGGAPTTGVYADASAQTFSYTVQNANSMLVIGFYTDSLDTPTELTFGGVAANDFITDGRTALAYWKNPDTGSGTFVASGITTGAFLPGAYELAGVDLNATVTSSIGTTITTPTDNEFVVSYAGRNINTAPVPTGTSIIDSNLFAINTGTSAKGSLGGGTGIAGLAGSQDVSWSTNTNDQGRLNYSFQAVPEPSALMLCALGTLLLLRRRRG